MLSSGTRDPLGFEVLWTNFGAAVFPYTTTQSVGAINYVVVSVLQHWIDEYVREKELPRNLQNEDEQVETLEALIVVAEQVVAYSVLENHEDTEHLYGISTARKQFGEDVRVGPFRDQRILKRQRGNGLFGRYEGPLTKMDVFEDGWDHHHRARVTSDWPEWLHRSFCGGSPDPEYSVARDALFEVFDELLMESNAFTAPFTQFADNRGAVQAMCRLRSRESIFQVAERLKDAMEVSNDHDDAPQRHVWTAFQTIDRDEAENISPHLVFKTAIRQSSSKSTRLLQDLLDLEEFLAPMEITFHRLWHVSDVIDEDEVVNYCWDRLQSSKTADGRGLKELANRDAISQSDTAYQRLHKLGDLLGSATDTEEFVGGLVDYHRGIMDDRDANPWVEVDGRKTVPLNEAFDSSDHEDCLEETRLWGSRDYYLGAFKKFRQDLVHQQESKA